MNVSHVLVTGGAGFIGSNLVSSLLEDDSRITIVDNFDNFYPKAVKFRNIAQWRSNPNVRIREVDIRNREALSDLLDDRYDAIIHLAARAGVRPSIDDPLLYQSVNVIGTQNLLEFARRSNIRQFIFASSSSVYGVNPCVPWREDDHVLCPISPYASTKVSCELLGHVYSHLYGIRFVALRFFTVYGPRQRPDLAIHRFARLIEAGCPVPIFGNGTTRRDYTYIDDIVSGIRTAVTYSGSGFEIINLGNHSTVMLRDMISELETALGKTAILEFKPEQAGDVPETYADISKAYRLLGYSPKTSFASGIRIFVNWLRNDCRADREVVRTCPQR